MVAGEPKVDVQDSQIPDLLSISPDIDRLQ
jgi:hypothetical protein